MRRLCARLFAFRSWGKIRLIRLAGRGVLFSAVFVGDGPGWESLKTLVASRPLPLLSPLRCSPGPDAACTQRP